MSAVISVFVDVNHDKPGDREAGHCGDQLGTALSAAAVPMQLRLTDTQSIERLAYLGNIVVIAQRRGQQVRARIEAGRDPDSSAQAVSMRKPSSQSRTGRLRRTSGSDPLLRGSRHPSLILVWVHAGLQGRGARASWTGRERQHWPANQEQRNTD